MSTLTMLLDLAQWTIPILAIMVMVATFAFFGGAYLRHQKNSLRPVPLDDVDEFSVEIRPPVWHKLLTPDELEDQILGQFFRQPQIGQAIETFLRRIVPDETTSFAAIVAASDDAGCRTIARGLSAASIESLTIPPTLVRRLRTENPLWIQGANDWTGLVPSVAEADRVKATHLHLTALNDGDEIFAVLVTSTTWPSELEEVERRPFMKRVSRQIGLRWRRMQVAEQNSQELMSTRDMLHLRSIVDTHTEEPLVTLNRFMSHLCESAEADRAAVYFVPRRAGETLRQVVRCGRPLAANEDYLWHRHEQDLASGAIDSGLGRKQPGEWLRNVQTDSLTTSAATMPIRVNGRVLGALCLTRRGQDDALQRRRQLIEYGAETLSHTLRRFVEDAAMRRQARHDHLTDLVNRRSFDAYLATEIERVDRRESPSCSLILADLDHFKSINDRFGHQSGDRVLRETARILTEQISRLRLGERGIVARYGGEEFAIILPNMGLAGASRIAEGIRAAIAAETLMLSATTLNLTISLGVAEYPQQADSGQSLLAAADRALYQAKADGRNRVCQLSDCEVGAAKS